MVQYNTAFMIAGAFKGTSHNNIYQELGLESFADRRWTRKLSFFTKIILGLLPSYLKNYLIPCDNLRTCLTRSSTTKRIKTFPARTKIFESCFFPHFAEAWWNLKKKTRKITSINTFKTSILKSVRPRENSIFEVHYINVVKL